MEIVLFFVPAILVFGLSAWAIAKVFFRADTEIEEPTDQELEDLGFTEKPAVVEVLNPPGPRYF